MPKTPESVERTGDRAWNGKHWDNPATGDSTGEFSTGSVHYKRVPNGAWLDKKQSLTAGTAPDEWLSEESDVAMRTYRTGSGGNAIYWVEFTELLTGMGIRFDIQARPTITPAEASLSWNTPIGTWTYTHGRAGGKMLSPPIPNRRGLRTYPFNYELRGGAPPLVVMPDGSLRCGEVFTMARPMIYGADGRVYPTSGWSVTATTITFTYDDTNLPDAAFPYRLDPTNTFANTGAANDQYVEITHVTQWPIPGLSTFLRDTTRAQLWCDKDFSTNSSAYWINCSLLAFDTSSLPDACVFNSAQFQPFVWDSGSDDAQRFVVEWYDWDGVSTTDISLRATNDAHVGTNISAMPWNSVYNLVLQNLERINRTGVTRIRCQITDMPAAPVGLNRVAISSFEETTYVEPKFFVDYTAGSAPVRETLLPSSTSFVSNLTPNTDPAAVAIVDNDPDQALTSFLTGTDPSQVVTTLTPPYPTAQATASGLSAPSWSPAANIIDTSETTLATYALALGSTNYGTYFTFPAAAFTGIPAGAAITNLVVYVRMRAQTAGRLSAWVRIDSANGTQIANELALNFGNTLSATTGDYTAAAFSAFPTRAQLVSGTFGVRLRLQRSTLSVTAELNSVKVAVVYVTAAPVTTNTEVRAPMQDPARNLSAGANTGEVRIQVRGLGTGQTQPTVRAEIREGGTLKGTPIPNTSVAVNGGAGNVFSGTFDQSIIADKNAAEIWVVSGGVSGRLVEVGAMRWYPTLVAAQDLVRSIVESMAPAETLAAAAGRGRAVVEAIAPAEVLSPAAGKSRDVLETTAPADAAAGQVVRSRSVSETIAPDDAAAASFIRSRSASEVMAPVDTYSKTSVYQRAVTETSAPSDALAAARALGRSNAETISPSDAPLPSSSRGRSVSETITPVEVAATSFIRSRNIAETIAPVDTPEKASVYQRAVTETSSPSDTLAATRALVRSALELSAPSDTLFVTYVRQRTIAEMITPMEVVAASFIRSRNVAEMIAPVDTLNRAVGYFRSVTETSPPQDALAATRVLARQVLEMIAPVDTYFAAYIRSRNVAETIAPDDHLTLGADIFREVFEAMAPAETPIHASNLARAIAETIAPADVIGHASSITRVALEAISPADALYVGRGLIRAAVELLGGVDTLSRQVRIGRDLSESLGVTEVIDTRRGFARTQVETLSPVDTLVKSSAAARAIVETISPTDIPIRGRTQVLSIVETMAGGDVLGVVRALSRGVAESITPADTLISSRRLARIVAEAVTSTDTVSKAAILSLAITEVMAPAEGITYEIQGRVSRSITESMKPNDALLLRAVGKKRALVEVIAPIDRLGPRSYGRGRAVNEVMAPADLLKPSIVGLALKRAVLESLAPIDELAIDMRIVRIVTENMKASDSLIRANGRLRSTLEVLGVTDSMAARITGLAVTREIVEALAPVDGLLRVRGLRRFITEQFSGVDVLRPVFVLVRLPAEKMRPTDTLEPGGSAAPALAAVPVVVVKLDQLPVALKVTLDPIPLSADVGLDDEPFGSVPFRALITLDPIPLSADIWLELIPIDVEVRD
jgi:hypothetical protein